MDQTASAKSIMKTRSGTSGPNRFLREFVQQKYLYLMVLPGFLIVLVFAYFPMYGVLVAFKDYNVAKGIWGSEWVGFKYFKQFLDNPMALRTIKNTLILGAYGLVFGFPAPIVLALLLNEIRHTAFKKFVQTVSYFPHFISTVIIVGMIKEFTSLDGLFNQITGLFGLEPINFMTESKYFRALFIGSGIWQGIGWGTILYLAALSNADPTLYDVASIDGANRWQKIRNISIPAIMPTIIILFIMSVGGILGTDFMKVLLMYNPSTYEKADVIDTYVYRLGIEGGRFEYAAAVGLMLSAVSFLFVLITNRLSRKYSETSLW
ncbi:carbohydrate ABC transporter membrane protein 1 (CUT1 family) [Paenibacillus taihuensis]|uniref:Carbohydrate ABC transporter membrane protein 1 (CUT1 family) n=1 Tax=Paenibacillus taihuensis TaxID=1156355 RepID=A0A3D9R5P1_9BACL|nr:carbohydrate ABC transporter membrane protein 1 (CUT1 family) [Paenibacillus taihuensis]